MGTTLEIRPETAERLRLLAKAQNVSVESFLFSYVPGLSAPKLEERETGKEDPTSAFDDWSTGFPPNTPPLPDEAISRSAIYREH